MDAHILYRLTWFATTSDLSSEVNNGRGPVDFKASRGSADKTLVEFKLASNPQLKKNLLNQVDVYKKASQTDWGYMPLARIFSIEDHIQVRDTFA